MTIGVTSFPDALDTLTSLIRAVNRAGSELTSDIDAVTDEITVEDASLAPVDGLFWIDAEAITFESKTGNTLEGCTRGANGTVPAAHLAGADVYFDVWAAMHHNVLAAAQVASQTKLGYGASTPTEGLYLKGGATAGTSAWGGITSSEIETALGFAPGPVQATPALVKVASGSAASQSALSLDDCFSDTYTNYLITIDRLVTTLAADFRIRLRDNGADDASAGDYNWATSELRSNNTSGNNGSTSDNRIVIASSAGAIVQAGYQIMVIRPFKSTETLVFGSGIRYESTTASEVDFFGGGRTSVASRDGFTIGVTSGVMTNAVVRVYGLVD